MKTNSIIKIDAAPAVSKRSRGLKRADSTTMLSVADDMESFWGLYESQLKRNGELMKIIDKQQQFIQKVMSKGALMNTGNGEGVVALNEAPLAEFKDLSVQKLFKYSTHFKKIFGREVKRLDGMQGMIKLLYTIKQLGGSASAAQLFEQTRVGKSTGFRNAAFLKKRCLIKRTGGAYDMQYTITKWGNEFLNCTLVEDYDKPMELYPTPEEGKKAWEHYFAIR